MKHQKELIEKYKTKWNKIFPYPMHWIVIDESAPNEKQYFIDILTFPYYYIFLFFRYKFPVVMYEADASLFAYRKDIMIQYRESEKNKNSKLNKFATRISPIAGVLGMFIHQLFPDIIDPIILPLLSIPTPYGYFYTMMVLFVVTLFVLYGIIKRNNELKQALKKDGVRKIKARVTRKLKLNRKDRFKVILTHCIFLFVSTLIFKLPKDMFSILLSILLSFSTVYSIGFLLYFPYEDLKSIEILEELEY